MLWYSVSWSVSFLSRRAFQRLFTDFSSQDVLEDKYDEQRVQTLEKLDNMQARNIDWESLYKSTFKPI